MKVFLSSVIGGMEECRGGGKAGSRDTGAHRRSSRGLPRLTKQPAAGLPRSVPRNGRRVVALLLGTRYGAPQASGLSPTHEEHREARGRKPVLTFVQAGVTPGLDQEEFIEEVSSWRGGGYRQPFETAASLAAAVTRGLHEWELNQQVGPVNESDLI